MAKYDLSQKAAEDLFSIWKYTMDNWSASQADNYYIILEKAFSEIAAHPLKLLFYLLQNNGRVLIVRILHEKMDYRKHL